MTKPTWKEVEAYANRNEPIPPKRYPQGQVIGMCLSCLALGVFLGLLWARAQEERRKEIEASYGAKKQVIRVSVEDPDYLPPVEAAVYEGGVRQ